MAVAAQAIHILKLTMASSKKSKTHKKKKEVKSPIDLPNSKKPTRALSEQPSASETQSVSNKSRKSKFGKRLNFILGAILGICGAFFFAVGDDNAVFDPATLDKFGNMLGSSDLFDDIKGYLSYNVFKDAPFTTDKPSQSPSGNEVQVGLDMYNEGYRSDHPVIMVPGVISSGLESWSFNNCSIPYFRKRLWGSWSMLKAMFLDKQCWLEHLMLDKKTGLDPKGIKLRAAQGFEAADFFITGYWIWSKVIENLAAIGYEPNNMLSASYDWRLSYANLEERDKYFSKLKMFIEYSNIVHKKKVVLISHSMGSQVTYYFFKWVEAEGYGNGGPTWVNDHIEAFINVSLDGCLTTFLTFE